MIPDYVIDEIVRRLRRDNLHRAKAKAICRMLGIDLDQALETTPTIDEISTELRELVPAGPVHEGAVWFQFGTGAEGSKRRVRGRIVFAATADEVDSTTGHMAAECQALVWRYGELAPTWQPFPEELLPLELLQAAYEEIDTLTAAKKRADAR